jgi:hypothetical protein
MANGAVANLIIDGVNCSDDVSVIMFWKHPSFMLSPTSINPVMPSR